MDVLEEQAANVTTPSHASVQNRRTALRSITIGSLELEIRPSALPEPHPVLPRLGAANLDELSRLLLIVEDGWVVRRIVRASVARRKRRKAEVIFYKAQDAARLVLLVRHRASFCEW